MLKNSLLLKKFTNFTGKNNSKINRIEDAKYSGYRFYLTQTYTEIFKSELVYL